MTNRTGKPWPGHHERLHAYLADVITSGTSAERKAAIEALIAEIPITGEGIIPVFKIPGPRTPIPGSNNTATSAATEPGRTMVRPVGRQGLEP